MKQAYFFRLTVSKTGRESHTLLIPTDNPVRDTTDLTTAWRNVGWKSEIDLTPFPGQGINASDLLAEQSAVGER